MCWFFFCIGICVVAICGVVLLLLLFVVCVVEYHVVVVRPHTIEEPIACMPSLSPLNFINTNTQPHPHHQQTAQQHACHNNTPEKKRHVSHQELSKDHSYPTIQHKTVAVVSIQQQTQPTCYFSSFVLWQVELRPKDHLRSPRTSGAVARPNFLSFYKRQ